MEHSNPWFPICLIIIAVLFISGMVALAIHDLGNGASRVPPLPVMPPLRTGQSAGGGVNGPPLTPKPNVSPPAQGRYVLATPEEYQFFLIYGRDDPEIEMLLKAHLVGIKALYEGQWYRVVKAEQTFEQGDYQRITFTCVKISEVP